MHDADGTHKIVAEGRVNQSNGNQVLLKVNLYTPPQCGKESPLHSPAARDPVGRRSSHRETSGCELGDGR